MCSHSSNVSVLIKEGVLFSGKSQRFLKIRVLFWPEISALGVFLNFDNERMHPPKYLSDPPGTNACHVPQNALQHKTF